MESGEVTDGQISASSEWDAETVASNGRLHLDNAGCWAARTNDLNQWLQVDLGKPDTIVIRVATQGRFDVNYQWVTMYKLQCSNDGVNFQYYKEQGDADRVSPPKHFLS